MEFLVAELIAALEFAVVVQLFLDGVIRQVNVTIVDVLDVELPAASAEVPLLVPVALEVSVDRAHHCEHSDVEFPALV